MAKIAAPALVMQHVKMVSFNLVCLGRRYLKISSVVKLVTTECSVMERSKPYVLQWRMH